MNEYLIRCSKFSELLAGCGKVKNEFKWENLDTWNESHIKLAIEIYNRQEGLFYPAEACSLDMQAGKEHEPAAVVMYDKHFKTNHFPEYEQSRIIALETGRRYEKSNGCLTGSRDFGDDEETIDCKVSTDKNVFDAKRFAPVDPDHVIQMNGYRLLYGTDKLWIFNALMPATIGQKKKFVSQMEYVEMYTDEQKALYEQIIDINYDYDLLPIAKRVSRREVPIIENFDFIVKYRVKLMNKWIEKNLA